MAPIGDLDLHQTQGFIPAPEVDAPHERPFSLQRAVRGNDGADKTSEVVVIADSAAIGLSQSQGTVARHATRCAGALDIAAQELNGELGHRVGESASPLDKRGFDLDQELDRHQQDESDEQ